MHEELKKVNGSERVKNYLDLVKEFQDQNLYQKAEDTLLLALKKIPNHPFLLTKLANFYNDTNRSDKALRTLKKLIKKEPDFKFPYYLRAKIYEEREQISNAIHDYRKALTYSNKDSYILSKLIPLLIANKEAKEAVKIIGDYQKLLKDPLFFSEIESEALIELGKNVEAFNKMRTILKKKPENKDLLRKYLKLSIQTSKKGPIELYNMLSQTVPQLKEINIEELTDLEVDYLIHHQKYKDAQEKIGQMVQQFPDRYYWRRKNIQLQKQIGNLDKIIDELEILVLFNPRDVGIRNIFEEYVFENNLIDRWKSVIHRIRKMNYDDHNFNNHLRELCDKNDLLTKSSLKINDFIENLETLTFDALNFSNVTYKKLPLYVLQTLIMQICIEDRIPGPEELWSIINKERRSSNKEIPFQLEDLNFALPIWLFGLQFIFLFKTYTNYSSFFKPMSFQKDLIALVFEMDGRKIELDICPLFEDPLKNFKSFIQINKRLRLRWPQDTKPEKIVSGIPIYSESQFHEIFGKLKSEIEEKINKS